MTSEVSASDEQRTREEALVQQVLASFDATPEPRLRELLQGVVTHLHAFLRQVRLTEKEWKQAIDFLTAVGHITDDRRQEFILLSDTLGASMQTIAINNEARGAATEATVLGPFFVEEAPLVELGGDISRDASGRPCWVSGRVTDLDGTPIAGARLDVWEADDDGMYDVQYADDRVACRGHLFTGDDGSYRFWGVTPTPYPIPHDGPVGAMLAATKRSPMRASHLHFLVAASGFRTLVTHIFVRGDELLASDSVFGVKESLIKDFVEQLPGAPTPDGRDVGDAAWTKVEFDIVLAAD